MALNRGSIDLNLSRMAGATADGEPVPASRDGYSIPGLLPVRELGDS